MHTDDRRKIIEFVEKPKDPEVLNSLRIPADLLQADRPTRRRRPLPGFDGYLRIQARSSPGVSRQRFRRLSAKNIIPAAIRKYKVTAYIFQGYWEDIGTIDCILRGQSQPDRSQSQVSTSTSLERPSTRIRAFCRQASFDQTHIDRSLICDGCVIEKASIEHSIIGIRSIVDPDTVLKDVILMGADYYEARLGTEQGRRSAISESDAAATFETAIIDKNARIGDNVVISPEGKDKEMNGEGFYIRDGIVVIPKSSVIASGTRI